MKAQEVELALEVEKAGEEQAKFGGYLGKKKSIVMFNSVFHLFIKT